MPLLARRTQTHAGTIYDVGDELDENAVTKQGRPSPLDAGYLIAAGQACDPALCEDPACELLDQATGRHAGRRKAAAKAKAKPSTRRR